MSKVQLAASDWDAIEIELDRLHRRPGRESRIIMLTYLDNIIIEYPRRRKDGGNYSVHDYRRWREAARQIFGNRHTIMFPCGALVRARRANGQG